MKNLILMTVTLFMASGAFAETKLRVPLVISAYKEGIPASEVNKKLKALGAPLLPTSFEYTESGDNTALEALDAQIEKSLSLLGEDYKDGSRQSEIMPGSNDTKTAQTCYIGDGAKVLTVIQNQIGIEYTEQLTIWGWRYKNIKKYVYGEDQYEADYQKESPLWKNWNKKSNDFLFLSAYSDDGSEIIETVISPCK